MIATGIVRRFDDLGRIVIPKEIRRQLFGTKYTDGEPMEIFMDKDDIILRKYEENKSDDVCELRLLNGHKFLHETSCGDVFDMQNGFKYCPYCGKKIKIVGDLYGMV